MPRESRRSSPGGSPTATPPAPHDLGPGETPRVCRLRVPLPDSAWVAAFSRENPEIEIEVLSRLDLDGRRSLTELRLNVPGPGRWADAIRALPKVDQVEELETGGSVLHLRVVHQTSEFVAIFRELHLIRRFPFTIRGGEASWVVVASQPRLHELLDRLREKAPHATLEAVRHADPMAPPAGLTPRQAELLRRALAAGYFEVPRKVTLTDLARNLGMAPSSLSEALRIVERKLVEQWPSAG